MYKLILESTGELLGVVSNPNFICLKEATGCFVPTKRQNATGVAYQSKPYNLFGTDGVGVEESIVISEIDDGEYISELANEVKGIPALEDAVCELDLAYEERIAAIEDALCELDKEE